MRCNFVSEMRTSRICGAWPLFSLLSSACWSCPPVDQTCLVQEDLLIRPHGVFLLLQGGLEEKSQQPRLVLNELLVRTISLFSSTCSSCVEVSTVSLHTTRLNVFLSGSFAVALLLWSIVTAVTGGRILCLASSFVCLRQWLWTGPAGINILSVFGLFLRLLNTAMFTTVRLILWAVGSLMLLSVLGTTSWVSSDRWLWSRSRRVISVTRLFVAKFVARLVGRCYTSLVSIMFRPDGCRGWSIV
jgi:hypothetical protein